MSDPLVRVSDFSYDAGGKRILDRVSFTVHPGEYLSIIGPNGAGKTTLLKCLCRVLRGGEGQLEIRGRSLASYGQIELAKTAAYVPQAGIMAFPFTVSEFVRMGRYSHLGPFSAFMERDVQAVHRALAMTETEDLSERTINSLSGGERQRVWIAAAVAQESEMLLLDEPATYLDPKHQMHILQILQSLNRDHGVTVLSVTHDVNGALAAGGRILALREGSVVFWGSGEELLADKTLEKIYSVPFYILDHPKAGKRVAAFEEERA